LVISRKGRKGIAKGAKQDGATLCGLGVSIALFAGRKINRKGAK